ncbi:hypothetical protein F4820DRAFT_430718 [Hypoxylon rubiginosum]|uniref:Uncharacterized protein n=1 Tax=Hypoxylon rubiginosum TaxID=110542 RepID=A0ACB9YTR3_9PEZI|nr:hypothetical protein F4820DRAFT_430718 [Hypoxylon rubiginosum]
MAGILGSYTDGTCNSHNALRNVSAYACGVTFSFKDSDSPPDMHYAVVTLQECCDMVGSPVLRVPGNTGCEMQFCEVPEATSSFSHSVVYGYATGSGTAAQTPEPTVTQGFTVGPPADVENCMYFVYERDVPENIEKQISDASPWCVVRMYDDSLSPSDEAAAVTASPAPPSWTSAAGEPWEAALSSELAASATASSTSTSNGNSRHANERSSSGVRIWAVAALMTLSLVAAL